MNEQAFIERLDTIERVAVTVAAKAAPWAITLPTAYVIGAATMHQFDWPLAVALSTGLGVEMLGIATSATAAEFAAHNTVKRDDDPKRPTKLAVGMAGLYFAGAVTLTAWLEGSAVLATFPVLSLAGTVILALRANHLNLIARTKRIEAREQEEKEAAKQERKAQREAAQVAKQAASVQSALHDTLQVAKKDAKETARERKARFVREMLSRNGQGPLTIEEIMSEYDIAQRTAYEYIKAYEQEKAARIVEPDPY